MKVPLPPRRPVDPKIAEAVRLLLARLDDRYSLEGAVLFGSRARGTHRHDSDVDVAVLLSGAHERFLDTKLAMSDAAFDVLLETGINISPLPLWIDEWEHPEAYSNPHLLGAIARDGVRL